MPRTTNPTFLVSTLLLALCTALFIGCEQSSPKVVVAPVPAPVPLALEDATVIGASVSAGCETSLPGFSPASLFEPQGHATFASVLGAVTNAKGPSGGGDTMFFMSPQKVAQKQIDAAKAKNPSILFAVDYLFWHAYGEGLPEPIRLQLLDEGLARLDTLACPIVVGDIPNMRHAAGILLSAGQVPTDATIAKLNEKIKAWAAARPRVVVVPLFETVGKAIKSEKAIFGGHTFEGTRARALLTKSGLHVGPEGLIALAYESLNQLQSRGLLPPNTSWEKDASVVMQRLIEAKKAKDTPANG